MEKNNILSEDYIRNNFFGLSFSRQIKLMDLYLIDLEGTVFYDYFKGVFSKYISIISKFSSFKENFSKFDHEGRSDLRSIISNRRKRVSSSDEICVDNSKYYIDCDLEVSNSLYYPKFISDEDVDLYIYNSFSYNKDRRIKIALDFVNYYSCVENMNFKQLLALCNGNCDLFNGEVKALSKDFYSLYLSMDVVQRMSYIWCLSHLTPFVKYDFLSYVTDPMHKCFSHDDEFIDPDFIDVVDDDHTLKYKKRLSKYFKMD